MNHLNRCHLVINYHCGAADTIQGNAWTLLVSKTESTKASKGRCMIESPNWTHTASKKHSSAHLLFNKSDVRRRIVTDVALPRVRS